jgi:hypothetical protein
MNGHESSARVIDISDNDALNPALSDAVIDGKQEKFMNADTIISIAKEGSTPTTRELWRQYRRALSRQKSSPDGRSAERLRADALRAAMRKMNLPLAQSRFVEFW